MSTSLAQNTAGIGTVQETMELTGEYFGQDTQEAVRKGITVAVLECVERSARELARRGTMRIKCLVTGGDGPMLLPHLTMDSLHQPHLVLRGIAEISEFN